MRSSKPLASAGVHQSRRLPLASNWRPFVVEGVGELVADGGAGVAVVGRVVELRVVERRLQHAGREVDVVHLRVEVGVDGRRRHAPLVRSTGLPSLFHSRASSKRDARIDVAEVVVRLDLERGVVAPRVGVADLVADGVQLAQRLLLGRGAHPVEVLDLVLHGGFDLLGHQPRLGLGVRGEGAGDELLAQRFAEVAVDGARAGLPARRHRGNAAQGGRVEVEVGLLEGLGEVEVPPR